MMLGEPAIGRLTPVAGSLLFLLVAALPAQDSTFLLSTTDPAYRIPAFIGNGAFSLVSTALGTTPAASYAAGVYDHSPGDVARLAEVPAWNAFDVSDGAAWLNDVTPDTAALRDYRQTLDLYSGVLHTQYEWIHGARHTAVDVTAFVSRADPHVAVVRLRLVPHEAGRLTVRFGLHAWPPPPRLALAKLERYQPQWTQDSVWYPGQMVKTAGDSLWITSRAAGGTTSLAEVEQVSSDTAGDTITDSKIVAVVTSLETAQPLARARTAARAAAAKGYGALLAEHTAAWHRLWQTDIVVAGDPELQRVVHAMLFYLLSSVREGTSESISPMGLSSDGYYGHVFWDADTWMFPALVALHPALARSMVDFRFRALPAALRNARANGLRGAMYPWESDEIGNEATPAFAGQNARWENHVTADVALAQWQYFLASGDSAWLARHGYPVIAATADFWVSRARRDARTGRYSIPHVVSVDEGMIGVGNDTYTNAAARKNLELAVEASRRLGRAPDPAWARVAAGLVMPYDSAGQYHPTYEGAPDSTRGSVVPLLAYPLALPMSDAAKRNDLDAAVARLKTEGGGAMMTVTLYAVVAGELGERALVDTLMPFSYREHLRPPFAVLAETAHNQAVNFLTGAGAFLQQIVYGWAGVRLGDQGLEAAFRPALPSSVRRLTLTDVPLRGRRYDIIVEGDSTRLVPK